MSRLFHRASRWQTLGVMLLAMMVGLRGMVPAGYMPDRSPIDGSIIIRMCGGIDDHYMALDPETGTLKTVGDPDKSPAGPQDHNSKSTCPFALTAMFDVPKDEALIQTAFFGPPLLSAVPVVTAPETSPARPPLPARGPPVRV